MELMCFTTVFTIHHWLPYLLATSRITQLVSDCSPSDVGNTSLLINYTLVIATLCTFVYVCLFMVLRSHTSALACMSYCGG